VENIFRRNLFLGMSALYLPFIAKKINLVQKKYYFNECPLYRVFYKSLA